jgi:hypothetical protein
MAVIVIVAMAMADPGGTVAVHRAPADRASSLAPSANRCARRLRARRPVLIVTLPCGRRVGTRS